MELMHRLEEQHAKMVVIMKEAKHKRDFGSFFIARMIRDDVAEKKRQLNGGAFAS